MRAYDAVPAPLRRWMAVAVLPWHPKTVAAAYARALARTGDPERALAHLDRVQAGLIARDARRVWGAGHPAAERP